MARSYQVNVTAATPALLADLKTLGGGAAITVLNSHASENLYIGGDENQTLNAGGSALTASTGLRIAAGQAYSLTINYNEAVYALSGNSTVSITAHVFRSNFKD